MHIRVTRRARRHKVGVAHILEVIFGVEPTLVDTDAASDARLVWIGQDSSGRTVRVVAVILEEEQELLVIHAMPDYRGMM